MFHSSLELLYGNYFNLIHIYCLTLMVSEEIHTDINVMWLLLISDCNRSCNRPMLTNFSRIPQISHFTQICSAILNLLHADTWTNRQTI
jgi:hypothetical protein